MPSSVFRGLGVFTGLALASTWASLPVAAEPTTLPAATRLAASAPASQPAALSPAVEKILDRQELKGRTIKDLQAAVRYTKEDTVLQDTQVFEGILRFKEEQPNPRFFIRFDKCTHDKVVSNKTEWHAFDGQWYTEARESTGSIVKREVLRPGDQRDIFRLGEGPFPLPFGQKKADIQRHFTVQLIPPAPKDPPNTDHLECTPLPGTKLADQYGTVHFYVDRDLELPVRLTTVQKEEDQLLTVSFSDVKLNTGMAGSALNLPEMPSSFSVTEERLPPPEK